MHIVATGSACPTELCEAVASASCFPDVFQTERPLAYHADCCVSIVRTVQPSQSSCHERFVVKAYRRAALGQLGREGVANEIQIHSSLQHPHIAAFLLAFEDFQQTYIVVEHADGGDLRKHLPGRDEKRIRDFVVQPLLRALSQVHDKGYSHRDLKPENVLVHGEQVKLADFGLAMVTHLSEDSCATSTDSTGSVSSTCSRGSWASCDSDCSTSSALSQGHVAGGTPLYAAPEVLQAMFKNHGLRKAVGPKNDVWALGVMALEAYTGCHPFSPDTHPCQNVLYSIAHHTKVNLPPMLSSEFSDWLLQALQRDPEQRPSAFELLDHPWMAKVYSQEEIDSAKRQAGSVMQLSQFVSTPFDSWEY